MVKDRFVDQLSSPVHPMKNCQNTMSATMTIKSVLSGMWSNACTCIISHPLQALSLILHKNTWLSSFSLNNWNHKFSYSTWNMCYACKYWVLSSGWDLDEGVNCHQSQNPNQMVTWWHMMVVEILVLAIIPAFLFLPTTTTVFPLSKHLSYPFISLPDVPSMNCSGEM